MNRFKSNHLTIIMAENPNFVIGCKRANIGLISREKQRIMKRIGVFFGLLGLAILGYLAYLFWPIQPVYQTSRAVDFVIVNNSRFSISEEAGRSEAYHAYIVEESSKLVEHGDVPMVVLVDKEANVNLEDYLEKYDVALAVVDGETSVMTQWVFRDKSGTLRRGEGVITVDWEAYGLRQKRMLKNRRMVEESSVVRSMWEILQEKK